MKKYIISITLLIQSIMSTSAAAQENTAKPTEVIEKNQSYASTAHNLPELILVLQKDLETYTGNTDAQDVAIAWAITGGGKEAIRAFYEAKKLRDGTLKMLGKFSVAIKMANDEQKTTLQKKMDLFLTTFTELHKQMIAAFEIIKAKEIPVCS